MEVSAAPQATVERRLPLPAMADHRTGLIRNCWYVAALGHEITRELRERTLLDTTVLMYRRLDGTPVIMNNRCVHRSFPLSRGRLDGDNVVCGYHGMVYNPQGRCIAMPALARAPGHGAIASYPVREAGPLVWVWMGEPALAEATLLPDTSWLDAPGWATVGGRLAISTNYVAMHENLLDQTHFGILHADVIGTSEYAQSDLRLRAEGDRVFIQRSLLGAAPPSIYGVSMGLEGKAVDRHSDSRFESPAAHVAHATIVDPHPAPGARAQFRVNITHLFTPEHQNSIHYWWFNSRDFALEDAAVGDYLQRESARAYAQDEDALNWIQATHDRASAPLTELSFGPDRPGLMMRTILLRLAGRERCA